MTKEQKDQIDQMSDYALLYKWRFEPATSGYFADAELFDYFSARMKERGVPNPILSKQVGWDK